MTFTCQNDPTHTYTETIPAKKYTFTVTVVDPTCTEQGYTLHTCNQNAEKSYKDNYTDALGHDYKEVTTPATCKDAGKVENICQRCGDTQHVKDLPVTEDHKWNDGVVTKAATCTEQEGRSCTPAPSATRPRRRPLQPSATTGKKRPPPPPARTLAALTAPAKPAA